MTKPILQVTALSKQYRLGKIGTGTLQHDLNRWWHKVRGKEDPYLKIGEINDRSSKGNSPYVWALRDVNFEVQEGEVLGIIGKNGAGKSTLLKLLSRVTSPTTGTIRARGRIASLLEVGTGFHPEMTGRENIYLNGAILGMTKKEIHSKIDEIISFSGCERYIDTPVKRYSSGMTVRLAFAVAAHLEPEILVIDEVLAVGDAEFQKKAIGKMQDISRTQGRTVLFVSHNMAAVKSLCTRGLVMEQGSVAFDGPIAECIQFYTASKQQIFDFNTSQRQQSSDGVGVQSIALTDTQGQPLSVFLSGETVQIRVRIAKGDYPNPLQLGIGIYSIEDEPQFHCATETLQKPYSISETEFEAQLTIPKWPLHQGVFYLNIYIKDGKQVLDYLKEALWLQSEKGDFYHTGVLPSWNKGFYCDYDWN